MNRTFCQNLFLHFSTIFSLLSVCDPSVWIRPFVQSALLNYLQKRHSVSLCGRECNLDLQVNFYRKAKAIWKLQPFAERMITGNGAGNFLYIFPFCWWLNDSCSDGFISTPTVNGSTCREKLASSRLAAICAMFSEKNGIKGFSSNFLFIFFQTSWQLFSAWMWSSLWAQSSTSRSLDMWTGEISCGL